MDPEAYQALPSAFTEDVLGLKLGQWQVDVLDSLLPLKSATALATANGAGKTRVIIAGIALWHAAAFPESTTFITSGSWTQIETQLIPSLHAHRGRLPDWTFNQNEIISPTGSFIRLHSTNDPGKAEGNHEKAGDPVRGPCLIIADEAKSIPQAIFQAFDRCTWTRYLMASSPGLKQGEFYNAFHQNRALFRKFTIPAAMCPWIDQSRLRRVIAKWGIDHPFVRSTVFAEFMSSDGAGTYAIQMDDVERNLLSPPAYEASGKTIYWCDFAAGGDENVLGKREGNRIGFLRCWREKDTFKSAAEFVTMLRRHGARPEQVYGDGSGLGISAFNDMSAMGFNVPVRNRIFNNSAAIDKRTYADRAAEMWFEAGFTIRDGRFILPTRDDEWIRQLTTRKVEPHSKGLMDLEPKDKMKSRGECSPDQAETIAALLTIDGPPRIDPKWQGNWSTRQRHMQDVEQFQSVSWD